MGAKVGIFSKSSPHKVFIPENHIQAFSFEIGSHLVSIPVCCRKDEITAPSPQGFQQALEIGEMFLNWFLPNAAADDALVALHEHAELVQILTFRNGAADF